MAKSIAKRRPGRPATGRDPTVTTRMPEELIESLDAWAEKEGMTRGEAMRWIIAQYFKRRSATGLNVSRRLVELLLKRGNRV